MSFVEWWNKKLTPFEDGEVETCSATRENNESEGYIYHVCCHRVAKIGYDDNKDLLAWGKLNLVGDAKIIATKHCSLISTKIESDALLCKLVWG